MPESPPSPASQTVSEPEGPTRTRRVVRVLLGIVVVGLTVHLLLPQLGTFHQTWATLRSARWGWLLLGLLASAVTYLMAGASVVAVVPRRVRLRRTSAVQLAASFTAQLGPGALGRFAINQRYLECAGVSRTEAATALGLHTATAGAVHTGMLLIAATLAGTTGLGPSRIPHNWPLLGVLIAVTLAVGGVMAGVPGLRRRLTEPARQALSALKHLRRPERAALLLATTVGLNVAYLVAFDASLLAFGAHVSLPRMATAYLFGSAVGAVSPTPGGLGLTEAALVASLTTVGTPAGTAVAAVLAFRLLTFWLPMAPGAAALHQLTARGIV